MHFRDGQIAEAIDLVKRHHYSRRAPGNVQLVCTGHEDGGLFGDFGRAVAALFLSIPPTRWSEDVWELSRLVRDDEARNLTGLIAFATKTAKKRGADLLVSFADKTQGHHGGIYQAASWNYAGARRRRIDGILWNGVFVTCRNCRHLFGTSLSTESVIEKHKDRIGGIIEPHYDEGKHLYWKPLGSRGKAKAARLGLQTLPYPKPNMESAAA